jgi:hypothetical protein
MVVAATEQYFNTMRQNYRIQTDEEKCAGKENKSSDVLAWLGLEASGFGFWDPQAKP